MWWRMCLGGFVVVDHVDHDDVDDNFGVVAHAVVVDWIVRDWNVHSVVKRISDLRVSHLEHDDDDD